MYKSKSKYCITLLSVICIEIIASLLIFSLDHHAQWQDANQRNEKLQEGLLNMLRKENVVEINGDNCNLMIGDGNTLASDDKLLLEVQTLIHDMKTSYRNNEAKLQRDINLLEKTLNKHRASVGVLTHSVNNLTYTLESDRKSKKVTKEIKAVVDDIHSKLSDIQLDLMNSKKDTANQFENEEYIFQCGVLSLKSLEMDLEDVTEASIKDDAKPLYHRIYLNYAEPDDCTRLEKLLHGTNDAIRAYADCTSLKDRVAVLLVWWVRSDDRHNGRVLQDRLLLCDKTQHER